MTKARSPIPSVDEVLRGPMARDMVARFGHQAVVGATRTCIAAYRAARPSEERSGETREAGVAAIAKEVLKTLDAAARPRLRRVFNLTGTVLHTNLGRAVQPEAAVAAVAEAMRYPAALQYDIATGTRGEARAGARGA